MKEFLDEKDAEEKRLHLEESLKTDVLDPLKEYSSQEINWCDEIESWPEAKGEARDAMSKSEEGRAIFIAHKRDSIEGKPQLIHQTMRKITLLRKIFKIIRVKGEETGYRKDTKFLDDAFDKRYDGIIDYEWALDFWIYRVIHDKKDYYVLSKEELPIQTCNLKGMKIEMKDFTEISKNMKIKSVSRVFFCHDFEPLVKVLEPEKIVLYTKEREITEEDWFTFLAYHQLGNYNRFPYETELLKSAHLLSGKVDGYPLHIAVLGPPGTRKSMGYIETMAFKFSEEAEIIEGGNSRIKGLSPSFKEKPANIGYLARCERMGWVDEIGKMVEFETNKHQSKISNVLGELNFLLDHKKRTVGSGNDNECVVQALAKFTFVSNTVDDNSNIYKHVGIIDPTTMSRILWWVQDFDEQRFVLSEKGIIRNPPTPRLAQDSGKKGKKDIGLGACWGRIENRDEFLTLFDTCNSFLTDLDETKAQQLTNLITHLSKEPMKSIWKPRGDHHVKLLIDGIVKHRCLFIDYDGEFKVLQKDYDLAEKLLLKMVKAWDTDLSIKPFQDFKDGITQNDI